MTSLMDNEFSEWLTDELRKRGWSQADLARAANIHRQVVSTYINGRRSKPDEDVLRSIARAFKMPPEEVFRAAGLLPPTTEDPWVENMNYKISQPTGIRRELAERLIDTMLEEQDRAEYRIDGQATIKK
jgi:transcriptional regulator with XRE-family HTH domain